MELDTTAGLATSRGTVVATAFSTLLHGGAFDSAPVSPAFIAKCEEDLLYHLLFLEESVRLETVSLFEEYCVWAASVLQAVGLPASCLTQSLEAIRDALSPHTSAEFTTARQHLARGAAAAHDASGEPETFLREGQPFFDLAVLYLGTLLRGDRTHAQRAVMDEIENGASIDAMLMHVLQPALREVGRLWQLGRISVALEHYSTAATRDLMATIARRYQDAPSPGPSKRAVVTCVGDEQHDLGARMVADMLEQAGWTTFYLGANTPAASVVIAVEDFRADLLGISTTVAFNLRGTSALITAVRDTLGSRVPILVGGRPFNTSDELWRSMGADAWAENAADAVAVADRLIGPGER